ncbi:MAG: hypothetical protein UY04_C0049G0015 [Parcubacteria group bacterium GW2011_GWA2_47_7]|nr:MAG: hypothetical protein UY04_C0049G0015 [Parcubacteria group bacterium GW2011_GWA2_47_7]
MAGVFHGVKDKTVSSWNDVQSEIKDVAENPEFMPEVPLGERGVFTEESAHTQEITAIDESAL